MVNAEEFGADMSACAELSALFYGVLAAAGLEKGKKCPLALASERLAA